MLTETQIRQIKAQIISQIEANFPEEKKTFAIKRIEEMNSEQLEEFLVKNNLVTTTDQTSKSSGVGQCVFCSIAAGNIASNKVAENESALAVLEINPISRGHVLIIPKEHSLLSRKPDANIQKLIKNISAMLKKRLKPKSIIVAKANLFGHETINLIPQFTNETSASERHPATPEELNEIKILLIEEKLPAKEKKPKKVALKAEEKIWLPKRIP